MIYELAKKDDRVVFIGSDLSPGMLADMKRDYPDRHYMEGVYEQNIIGMAAGLAMEGYIPYVNTIATFITRRCYEQVAVDICMHNLPIRLIGNGGGVVYAPLGPTHLATEDISIMRALPNMTVIAVSDAKEMVRMMHATLEWKQPIYIRLGKGGDEVVSREENGFSIGEAICMHDTRGAKKLRVVLISTGVMTQRAIKVAKGLEAMSIGVTHLHCHTVKPLDTAQILFNAREADLVVTVEENTLIGGLGSAVTDCLIENLGRNIPLIKRFGLPDRFPDKYGSQELLLDYFGLCVDKLMGDITALLQENFPAQLSGAELSIVANNA
jgi:transketolase